MKKLEGFTPGPWRHGKMARGTFVELEGGAFVADCSGRGSKLSYAEREANAALIAQAPTLLGQRAKLVKALRGLQEYTNKALREGRNLRKGDITMAELLREAERVLAEVEHE